MCLLQVSVGQVASWIVGGHDALLDVFREGGAPHNWVFSISKEDPAHSSLCSNHSTDDAG